MIMYSVVISLGYAHIRYYAKRRDYPLRPTWKLCAAVEAKCRAPCSSGQTTFQVCLEDVSFGLVQLSCWQLLIVCRMAAEVVCAGFGHPLLLPLPGRGEVRLERGLQGVLLQHSE